jgi:hypothetical protein
LGTAVFLFAQPQISPNPLFVKRGRATVSWMDVLFLRASRNISIHIEKIVIGIQGGHETGIMEFIDSKDGIYILPRFYL